MNSFSNSLYLSKSQVIVIIADIRCDETNNGFHNFVIFEKKIIHQPLKGPSRYHVIKKKQTLDPTFYLFRQTRLVFDSFGVVFKSYGRGGGGGGGSSTIN